MQIISINDTNATSLALQCLKSGGILIYPTETSYGVGVDATNSKAVSKVLDFKKRPGGKAISIGVSSQKMALKYVDINKVAENLYIKFLPGALTIISKSKHNIDKRLESENGSLGIRIPNYKFLLNLINNFDKPITTTSANSAGKKTPYCIKDIIDNLNKKQINLIDLIIDAGDIPHNPPSTVIDTTTEELTTYRQGRINPKNITKASLIKSNSTKETILAGKNLMQDNSKTLNKKATLILLNGELGAGKTHFTKGIADTLGIKNVIKSPTYNYVNEYNFDKGKLYHMDAWRIQNIDDLKALKFYEWFVNENVIVVEWPTVIMNLDPEFFDKLNYIYVDFIVLEKESREIKIYNFN